MERETGPTGPIAVLTGRRNGKSAFAARKEAEREHAAEVAFHAAQHRRERREERMQAELYRRRFEFPTGARSGGYTPPVACPHMRAVHYDEPHPRYGDRFPITRTVLRKVKGPHDCVAGVNR